MAKNLPSIPLHGIICTRELEKTIDTRHTEKREKSMVLKECPSCGGAAEIRAEQINKIYAVRAICTGCGIRTRPVLDTIEPAAGAASVFWAGMNWNCGLYEKQEGKA